jgi:malonate transporter and related proteins
VVMVSGVALPAPIHAFLKLLGGAASPCALIALGLFLAGTKAGEASARATTTSILVGLKLIAQPAVTWLIAAPLLNLPPAATHTAVLLAALPTGTGPFMLAEFYGREASVTGRVVLASTVLSVLTISAYLAVAGRV